MSDQPTVTVAVDTDLDSTYDDSDAWSYATSLSSSVEKYKWENGRRYHSYREGAYNFPNDEKEQDRLDMNHHLCLLLLDNELHFTELPQDRSIRILDIGTGTGIWAMEMGDKFPNAQVIGNELSPIQPRWVPPNVQFEIDDAESPWPPREPFDFIHIRYMLGSIQNWPRLLRQSYENLTPGGWIELQDFNTLAYSEDGSAADDNKILEFCQDAGFVNVRHEVRKVPIDTWARDKKLKQIGALYRLNLEELLEAALLGLLVRVENWKPEEVNVFIAQIRTALKDKSVHVMQEFHVVWAQKPEK
ncbi:hypothetical protein EKO04_002129 [Ascochyta lentis]|uniref:Methyltransferase n=1 Tax=Ascochyta lentis TaxID=205686 RepID=A0A8H7J9G3_9PLEO|nr:hypothetical protein EKO04_002129 [Ascochyta lentis]